MARTLPREIPSIAYVGQTFECRRKFFDAAGDAFAPSTWTATLYLRSETGRLDITATADSDFFKFYDAAFEPDSGTLLGKTSYFVLITDGTDTLRVAEGEIDVKPDPTAASNVDFRSHVRKVLDKIEAVLEGTADHETLNYTISTSAGSRSLSKVPREELLDMRRQYKAELRAEQRAAKRRSGKRTGQTVKARFSRQG